MSIPTKLTFLDCMSFRCELNWNVICISDGEMIDGADIGANDPFIDLVRARWSKILDLVLGDLGFFRLTMADTGSTLELVFRGVRIEPTGPAAGHTAPPALPLPR